MIPLRLRRCHDGDLDFLRSRVRTLIRRSMAPCGSNQSSRRVGHRELDPALGAVRRGGHWPTVIVEHIAWVAVHHPEVVAAGRYHGRQVATCVPFDPESKGGPEASVRVAKADLVPTEANLLEAYPDMAALVAGCDAFCARVNAWRHREIGAAPLDRSSPTLTHHLTAAMSSAAALIAARVAGMPSRICCLQISSRASAISP